MDESFNKAAQTVLKGKKAAYLSLGCKVNSYETEAIQQLFEDAGVETVDFDAAADIYVINTCTVTNIADRKSRQMLHKAKKNNPDGIVVAAGCYVQASAEAVKQDTQVDVLIGNTQKQDIVRLVAKHMLGMAAEDITEISQVKEYDSLRLETVTEKTRAYIKIQDGCNQFCSYCIIPFARGRIRSRSDEDVLEEVTQLTEQGYQEIVLTGIHLSSYGFERFGEKERFELVIPGQLPPLLTLIQKLSQIPKLRRIRLGSLEPRIITEEFASALAQTKVCPHFHLSLQSGCDATLERMNRRYDTARYTKSVEILRRAFEHPAITTDVIVGFPGETEEEFDQTVRFIKKTAFAQMHIFRYSRRQGTKADRMQNQVPEEIKVQRSNLLLELEQQLRANYNSAFIGRKTEVLMEEQSVVDGCTCMIGHNERYVRFALKTEANLANRFIIGYVTKDFVGETMLILEEEIK